MAFSNKSIFLCILLILFVYLTAGCNQPTPIGTIPTQWLEFTQEATDETQSDPATTEEVIPTITTTTIVPAIIVNGEIYPEESFKNDLLRFMMANPEADSSDAYESVTQNQIVLMLLAQAAFQNEFVITEETITDRENQLIEQMGGTESFQLWLNNNYYTQQTFREALRTELAVQYQKQFLFDQLPTAVEQVELSQILVYDRTDAERILAALESGATQFAWQTNIYHPVTRGYLGWNPRGGLLPIEVEEIAFSLEINNISDIIETEFGYHIIQLNSRQIHPLSLANSQIFQARALYDWIDNQKETADIQILAVYEP
jgi:ABC-type transport system substrate-binding protein